MIRSLLVLIATIFLCLVVVNIGNECLMVLFRMAVRRALCDVLLQIIDKQIAFDPLVFFFCVRITLCIVDKIKGGHYHDKRRILLLIGKNG